MEPVGQGNQEVEDAIASMLGLRVADFSDRPVHAYTEAMKANATLDATVQEIRDQAASVSSDVKRAGDSMKAIQGSLEGLPSKLERSLGQGMLELDENLEELEDVLDRLADVESSSRDASNGLLVTVKRAEALIGDQQRLIAEQRSQIDVQQRQIEALMKTLGTQANKEKHKTGLFARFLSWSF